MAQMTDEAARPLNDWRLSVREEVKRVLGKDAAERILASARLGENLSCIQSKVSVSTIPWKRADDAC